MLGNDSAVGVGDDFAVDDDLARPDAPRGIRARHHTHLRQGPGERDMSLRSRHRLIILTCAADTRRVCGRGTRSAVRSRPIADFRGESRDCRLARIWLPERPTVAALR